MSTEEKIYLFHVHDFKTSRLGNMNDLHMVIEKAKIGRDNPMQSLNFASFSSLIGNVIQKQERCINCLETLRHGESKHILHGDLK